MPDRRKDPVLNAELETAVTYFINYIFEKIEKGYTTDIDQSLADKALTLAQNPIFVCGPIKSGTTLLSNLLDSHPSLMVLPEDSYYAIHAVNGYLQDRDLHKLASYHIRKYLINRRAQWFLPKQEKYYLDFVNWLKYYLETSDLDPLACVAMALFCSNPNCSGNERYWVEKTASSEYFIQNFYAPRYPNAKYIHILREPLNTLASIKKLYTTRQREFLPIGMSYYLSDCHKLAANNSERFGPSQYHIVSYEGLIAIPEETMGAIAKFLDIDYDEILLTPTLNGEPATANTMFKDHTVTGKITKFKSDNKWIQTLTGYEKFCAINFLKEQPVFSRYDWSSPEIRRWSLPFGGKLVVKGLGKIQGFYKKRPGPANMPTIR